MSVIDFYAAAEELKIGEINNIIQCNDFNILLQKGRGRLHTCGADEFFYVLKGKGELVIDSELFNLSEGQGMMVEAGKKHKRQDMEASWLVITKRPHKHVFFDE